jgi:hypothetical protein
VTDPSAILTDLLKLGSEYGGCQAHPNSRLYADLDINGSDFIESVEEVERRFCREPLLGLPSSRPKG